MRDVILAYLTACFGSESSSGSRPNSDGIHEQKGSAYGST